MLPLIDRRTEYPVSICVDLKLDCDERRLRRQETGSEVGFAESRPGLWYIASQYCNNWKLQR